MSTHEDALTKIKEDTRWWAELSLQEQNDIDFKFRRAVIQVLVQFPFFGYIAVQMSNKAIWVKREEQLRGMGHFRTMATDGTRLYIWPQFVLYNEPAVVMGVVIHEILHAILLHIERGRGYNHELANVAMDYVVNMMVNDLAMDVAGMTKATALDDSAYQRLGPKQWYVPAPPYFHDEKWRNPTTTDPEQWERVYEQLLKQQDPETQKRLSAGMCVSDATGGRGLRGVDPNQQGIDSHDFWNPKNRPADEEGKVHGDRTTEDDVRDMIRDAYVQATQEKMRGHMPAGLERMLHEYLHPPLPWQRLVQRYLRPTDGWFSYAPGDTRFEEPMVWFTPEQKLRYIIIAIDTSGSMSDEEVGKAITQARHLLRGFPQTKGILCMCDATVSYWEDIQETYAINKRVGCGGTDFTPPFEKVIEENLVQETDLLIYFTDGYGNFPDREWLTTHNIVFDTLWVITNKQITPPDDPSYTWTRIDHDN